jgi:peptidoglycan/LPS O-acetylase OafA/YrhL
VSEAVLGAVGLGGLLVLLLRRDQAAGRWLAALAALALASLALLVYNSMVNDFQPQGRYLFPLLVPCALYSGWIASRHRAILCALALVALLMLGLLLVAHFTISGAYPDVATFFRGLRSLVMS